MMKPHFKSVYGVSIPEEEKFEPEVVPEETNKLLLINERLSNLKTLINKTTVDLITTTSNTINALTKINIKINSLNKNINDLYSKLNLKQNLPTS